MAERTMDEVRAEHVRVLGEELGASFYGLHRELIELHIVWDQYVQLYGRDATIVALLNRTAGLFFKIVQDQLWDAVLLGISKMTDPVGEGARRNLTIHALPGLISDEVFRSAVIGLCKAADDQAKFARAHRNKRIAHQDHNYFVNRSAVALAGISRAQMSAALGSLAKVMNAMNHRYFDSECFYDHFVGSSGAELLVAKLSEAATAN